MHYKICQICGLRSGKNNSKKRQFMAKFPLDHERCKQWVKFVGKEDLAHVPVEKLHTLKYVCGKHFKSKDFKKKKTQLKRTAIPSVDLRLPQLCDDVLIEFPLHVAKENIPLKSHFGSPTNIALEHNYCKLYTSHKRPHSPGGKIFT